MLTNIDVDDLAKLSRDIRAVDRDFANAMQKELRDAVSPFTATLKQSARTNLPSFIAADAASTIKQSVSYKGVSVKSSANSRFSQAVYVDTYGKVRHPLFGNKSHWFNTNIYGGRGWLTKVGDDNVDETAERLIAAVNLILNRVATGNLSTVRVGRATVIA